MLLMAALVGCGSSGRAERGGAGERPGHRGEGDFAFAREVCAARLKADFAVESLGIPADSGDRAIARGYAAQLPRDDRKAALAGCLKGLAGAPARFPRSSPAARALWGRNFVVTSISPSRAGVDPPVAEPYHIRLWFSGEPRHAVSWKARCNSIGADARITARRMEIKMNLTTLIGCPPREGREDLWLDRFFESDPSWRLDGKRLLLVSDGVTIELRGRG